MRHSAASKGICDRCDEYSSERYIYEFMSPYGRTSDDLCESCFPKCALCNSAFSDEEDLCEQCMAVIELEEKA